MVNVVENVILPSMIPLFAVLISLLTLIISVKKMLEISKFENLKIYDNIKWTVVFITIITGIILISSVFYQPENVLLNYFIQIMFMIIIISSMISTVIIAKMVK